MPIGKAETDIVTPCPVRVHFMLRQLDRYNALGEFVSDVNMVCANAFKCAELM